MKVKIESILNSRGNSFGDKTIVFRAENNRIYEATRYEGDHSELEIGKFIYVQESDEREMNGLGIIDISIPRRLK